MVRWLFSSDDYWLKLTDGKWLESPDTNIFFVFAKSKATQVV